MSHHLLPKKVWSSLILIPCIFFAMVFAGLEYLEKRVSQIETPIIEGERQQSNQENDLFVQEAALQKEEAVSGSEIEKIKWKYPCKLQMKQERIGVYADDDRCIKEFKQVGEYLSEVDRLELQKGIWVETEQELIILLESFHLQ